MELKHGGYTGLPSLSIVLIVPSGIETTMLKKQFQQVVVLIVPSGIETLFLRKKNIKNEVLIVPSGIETSVTAYLRNLVSGY